MDPIFGFGQPSHPPQPNHNLFGFPYDTGDPRNCSGFGNPYQAGYSALANVPLFPVSGFQQSRASKPNDSMTSFYRTPHLHHNFAPELNSLLKERLSKGPFDFGQQRSPMTGALPARKRFIVFDHSGDKTTLIYTSGETQVQLGASLVPNPSTAHNLWNKGPWDSPFSLGPTPADEKVEDNSRDILDNEVHEDTEELNALLCSDTDFAEDDEETSTGHSPSTMTDNHALDIVEESGEEVDSFTEPTKRQKLHDGGYNIISNSQIASPLKTLASASSLDYDAQSSCGDGNEHCKVKPIATSGGKRSKKEKIRETLSILQSVIPTAEGKDAIDVIDEAIHYLRSLKAKAKALGLDTL